VKDGVWNVEMLGNVPLRNGGIAAAHLEYRCRLVSQRAGKSYSYVANTNTLSFSKKSQLESDEQRRRS
jgi:hypothetical protein